MDAILRSYIHGAVWRHTFFGAIGTLHPLVCITTLIAHTYIIYIYIQTQYTNIQEIIYTHLYNIYVDTQKSNPSAESRADIKSYTCHWHSTAATYIAHVCQASLHVGTVLTAVDAQMLLLIQCMCDPYSWSGGWALIHCISMYIPSACL